MLKNIIKIFLFLLIKFFPKNKKLLVFGDRAGIRYADNSRYLFLYLNKFHKEYECIWLTKEKKIYNYIKSQKYKCEISNSLKGIYYALRANYHLYNFVENDINKLITTFSKSILLWHGVLPKKLKTYTSKNNKKKLILKLTKKYFLHPNKIMSENILDHFPKKKYDLFLSNLPRNIILNEKCNYKNYLRTDDENKFVYELKQKKMKIFGYFPTWRTNGLELFGDVINLNKFDELNNNLLKKNSIILIIKHMNSDVKDKHPLYNQNIEKISSYLESLSNFKFVNYDFDLNSILEICDILISDYSGVIFDYLYLNKPIIIYAPDYEKFINDNGFVFDPIKNKFASVALDFDSLQKTINSCLEDYELFKNKFQKERNLIKNKVFFKDTNFSEILDIINK